MGYVYKFTNKQTKKWYIGSHNKPSKNSKYMGSGVIWNRALKKYGKDAFIKEILYEGENFRDEEHFILMFLDAAADTMSYNMINDSCGATLIGNKNGMYGKNLQKSKNIKEDRILEVRKDLNYLKNLKAQATQCIKKIISVILKTV